ncbi:unnamed protein product [Rotaria socialis]|uniref:Retrotransposon gag domain-containing protein n=2 Tax=Rotaria socialis TaxID=392032 RepID=A0A817LJ40_9BILA|nr:unnamed protein product [Rotaria socialis]
MEHPSFDKMDDFTQAFRQSTTPTNVALSKIDYINQDKVEKRRHITLESIQDQLESMNDRLVHIEETVISRKSTNMNSRPSSRSVRIENSTNFLPEYIQAQEEKNRRKIELALARSQMNNNESISYPNQSLSLVPTQSPIHMKAEQFSYPQNQSSVSMPTNIMTPNVIRAPPRPTSSTVQIPPLSSLDISSLSTLPYTMHPNNNLPKFKGSADERPVGFLSEFEIRTATLVGKNDTLLLHAVQQALFGSALTWFGQMQNSDNPVRSWSEFKTRFYDRYRTPNQIRYFRTELNVLFQGDNERTMDFLERLKSLMIEIDPNCNEEWLIRKFVEKIRLDIRARLDFDANLTMRELIKKILTIESNIDELKIVEDLRRTALQKRKPPVSITTNNISFIDSSDQYAPSSSNKPTDHKQNYNQHSHNNNNNSFDNNRNRISAHNTDPSISIMHRSNDFNKQQNTKNMNNNHHNNNRINNNNNNNNDQNNNYNSYDFNSNNDQYNNRSNINNFNNNCTDEYHSNRYDKHGNATKSQRPTITLNRNSTRTTATANSSNNYKTRWWCPRCERHGHSWERCPFNTESINYRPNSTSCHFPTIIANSPSPVSPSPSHYNNSHSENHHGR